MLKKLFNFKDRLLNTGSNSIRKLLRYSCVIVFLLAACHAAFSQTRFIPFAFGDMDKWINRDVKESFVIGGKTQTLYEIADTRDGVSPNHAYDNKFSPWATSSVLATINGITKGSVTVFPEKRGDGFAARLETRVERVKVLGILNINVLASGTIFLGKVAEPITDTDNPFSKLIMGIPFTGKPAWLQFDYKVTAGGSSRKINGLSSNGTATGKADNAIVHVYLQKRWEDKDGNVYALRIGTGGEIFSQTINDWQKSHRVKIHYGNVSNYGNLPTIFTRLKKGNDAFYTRNSKGKMVPIHEEGWGSPNNEVTHIILQFSSSDGGPYVGSPQNKLWVDNVGTVYD